ncbi:MAG: metal ABC transporter ATP-binding protein [bacterium]|nr:metal ABC transporter ATP-binding protein [bacterium]
MAEPILKVKNLNVRFGDHLVLENVNFELSRNQALAVIGPNGAGKTVLFKALIGATPFSGDIEWSDGVRFGYVPQRLDLDPQLTLTLRDLLMLKIGILKLSPDVIDEVISLAHVDKKDLDKRLVNLAAGIIQRGLIALALIGDTNVLLFDEPTSGVDSPREELIYETLHELQDHKELTLMFISHDLNLVYRYATQVLCINKSMLCFGEPQKTLNTDVLTKLYGERVLYHHHHPRPDRDNH